MDTIVIAESRKLVREALAGWSARAGFQSVALCRDGHEARCQVDTRKPDWLMTGIGLPGIDGLELAVLARGRNPRVKLVAVTSLAGDDVTLRIARVGFDAVLRSPECGFDELSAAVATVAAGGRWLAASYRRQLDALLSESDSIFRWLTAREMGVLRLVAQCADDNQIACAFGIAPRTVETFRTRLRRKLGVRCTTELIRIARRHGLHELAPVIPAIAPSKVSRSRRQPPSPTP